MISGSNDCTLKVWSVNDELGFQNFIEYLSSAESALKHDIFDLGMMLSLINRNFKKAPKSIFSGDSAGISYSQMGKV